MRNQDANRPQRIKIIIIAVIVAILVFIFGAWLITSAIKSVEKKNQSTRQLKPAKLPRKMKKPSQMIKNKRAPRTLQKTIIQAPMQPMATLLILELRSIQLDSTTALLSSKILVFLLLVLKTFSLLHF